MQFLNLANSSKLIQLFSFLDKEKYSSSLFSINFWIFPLLPSPRGYSLPHVLGDEVEEHIEDLC